MQPKKKVHPYQPMEHHNFAAILPLEALLHEDI